MRILYGVSVHDSFPVPQPHSTSSMPPAGKGGLHATKVQDILELLEDYGEIPDALEQTLAQASPKALKTYHKLAAKADSIEAFMTAIE